MWSCMWRGIRPLVAGALLVGCSLSPSARGEDAAALEYNRDVRPILFANCFACHGPDSASREADLRLDQRDAAVDMGAIVPGDPDSSELLRRIVSHEEYEVMPPPETKKKVTAAEIKILARWIEQGAEYQPHWSLIPPQRPELPEVAREDWVRNPIDRFILARLEAAGLTPQSEADRRALCRRVCLDLTGLPPTAEMVEEFVADQSPDAYERLVDKLLASPQWGQHRGRYWLDYARYGDTHGIHFDNYREMWTYREWVVDTFNLNMPYDQFTIENLAGDLLPEPTLAQRIGSGFNRCNITTNEGGIIDEEYRVLYARDRTETTAQVWMGLTANCAVCHSHKFDPLSQKEFYELSAFFNNTTQGARDGNIKDTPPIVRVPLREDRTRYDELPELIAQARAADKRYRDDSLAAMQNWVGSVESNQLTSAMPGDDPHLYVSFDATLPEISMEIDGVETAAKLTDKAKAFAGEASPQSIQLAGGTAAELPQVGDFAADQAFTVSAWLWLPGDNSNGAVVARMDNTKQFRGWDLWLQRNRVGGHIIHKWPGNALKAVTKNPLPAKKWVHVAIVYNGSKSIDGLNIFVNGQRQEKSIEANTLRNEIQTDVPLKIGQRHTNAPATGVAIDELRIYKRELAMDEVAVLGAVSRIASLLEQPIDEWTDDERTAVHDFYLTAVDDNYAELNSTLKQLESEQGQIEARGSIAHVMQEKPSTPEAYLLNRGEYDQRLERVTPGTPDMLPPMDDDLPRNRLGLAQWLVSPAHPLTARVTVNRSWQELFGRGLVRTAGDFGVAGELPTHPELLDWLAVEFRESGWDVKQLYKLVVMSATYRQAAVSTPASLERDPDNKLLSRGARFRMDAEMVRDGALSVSGLLIDNIGGPSVKPYQPAGVWEAVAMPGSNTRNYAADKGDGLYRRSMYTLWKRSAPPASMEIFNAPSREHCVVTRERTNTPLQALAALNDVQMVEAARNFAQQALDAGQDDTEARIQWMGARLVARSFTAEEMQIIVASHEELSSYYTDHPDDAVKLIAMGESKADEAVDAVELATWTMLANELMNLDEVLCK